jgi:2-polyprenyl-3-methyl-5-hydroxy-6-metoxy-1,4-benzoquinol methylase
MTTSHWTSGLTSTVLRATVPSYASCKTLTSLGFRSTQLYVDVHLPLPGNPLPSRNPLISGIQRGTLSPPRQFFWSKERVNFGHRLINGPLIAVIIAVNGTVRKVSAQLHRFQMALQWKMGDNPEYFDHFIDLHYQLTDKLQAFPFQRGVWSLFAFPQDTRSVLDIACGDGFFTKQFYASTGASVVAIDFDPQAIKFASRYNSHERISYVVGDVRNGLPDGSFDVITLDAALEHFTEQEIHKLMSEIKDKLAKEGVLSGYTIKASETGHKLLHQHEYEPHSKEDLARFLKPYFSKVQVFETTSEERTNYFFHATDGVLPLDSVRSLKNL